MHNVNIQNMPVTLEFAGMIGNTYDMQSRGWEFSYNQEYGGYEHRYSIAGRHRGMQLYMFSGVFAINNIRNTRDYGEYLRNIRVPVKACAERIEISMNEMPSFQAVDFSARNVVDLRSKNVSFEDMLPFAPTSSEADLFVPKEEIWTIEKHFEAIKEAQKDRQAELREKKRVQELKIMQDRGRDETFEVSQPLVKLKLIAV